MGLALVFLLILGSIWGVSTTTQKLALEAYAPLSVMFWYALIAFSVLALISAFRDKIPPFDRRHLFYYLASGLCGFAIPGINNLLVLAANFAEPFFKLRSPALPAPPVSRTPFAAFCSYMPAVLEPTSARFFSNLAARFTAVSIPMKVLCLYPLVNSISSCSFTNFLPAR